jgi:PAS domain-containing protein
MIYISSGRGKGPGRNQREGKVRRRNEGRAPGTREGFEGWYAAVNEAFETMFGLSRDDVADAPYREYFEDGMGPMTAARAAMRRAM